MNKLKVFVIMPFENVFFEVFEMLKREFIDKYEFINAGDEGNQQNILKDIFQPIYESDIIIADLTGLNPNVLYELGVAHTLNKKSIVITQDDLNLLPFDLKQYRAMSYNTYFKKFAELVEYLKINLEGAAEGNIIFSNPIKDFLSSNNTEKISEENKLIIPDDCGFFDFITEIEENTVSLTENINNMIADMELMTSGVNQSSNDIRRVTKNGGNGTAAFIRKEAKKVAGYIETFSSKLKIYNPNNINLWNKIEKNTLGLLENKFIEQGDNKDDLISYLQTLKGMQNNILKGNESVEELRTSLISIIGMERTLNQAARFLDEDLSAYLNVMDQIYASIGRILGKSKFVVGEINFSNEESSTI